jgi:Ser/Thr protein kinase RdoA (MazF antagonist)
MPSETGIREKFTPLFEYLQTLPRDPDGYGMIHEDAHTGNLFVDEEYTLTLFDFDDCGYGHFIYDIAMVLFYIVGWGGDDRPGFTGRFMPAFLQGYRQYNRLQPRWLPDIPRFLKLREIDLFAAILFTEGEQPEDAWCARFMQGRREKIMRDVPFIEFDWESLGKYL